MKIDVEVFGPTKSGMNHVSMSNVGSCLDGLLHKTILVMGTGDTKREMLAKDSTMKTNSNKLNMPYSDYKNRMETPTSASSCSRSTVRKMV